jgi:hypothetical protein
LQVKPSKSVEAIRGHSNDDHVDVGDHDCGDAAQLGHHLGAMGHMSEGATGEG